LAKHLQGKQKEPVQAIGCVHHKAQIYLIYWTKF